MISVDNFDDANIHRFKTEMHQTINFSRSGLSHDIDLRSSPYRSLNPFSELNSTSTTLYTSLENKIEELNSKKELLLINRNKIFNSLSYRFFSLGKDKINLLDRELDRIEEEIYCLRRPELQKEILSAKDLIEKTNKNLLKYKLETF
ncbi:MAG: hypothetical protein ACH350_05150 [Parachlamydiaceae bacterium]